MVKVELDVFLGFHKAKKFLDANKGFKRLRLTHQNALEVLKPVGMESFQTIPEVVQHLQSQGHTIGGSHKLSKVHKTIEDYEIGVI